MSKNIGKLIDQICNDNDYLLTFQATEESRKLLSDLIELINGKTTDFTNVLASLSSLITLLKKQINEQSDELDISYLEDILYGVNNSYNRIEQYNKMNELTVSFDKLDISDTI